MTDPKPADAGLLTDEELLDAYHEVEPGDVVAGLRAVEALVRERMQAEIDRLRGALAGERLRLAEIEGIVHYFCEDEGADPIVGKVQELRDCDREASADLIREQAGRKVAVEALGEIAVWTQESQDGADRDLAIAQWRGCVAIARAALSAQPDAKEEPK